MTTSANPHPPQEKTRSKSLRGLSAGETAARLAEQGFPVVPLAGGLKEPNRQAVRMATTSQHPLNALLQRPLNPQAVRRITDRYPEAGWGLLLDHIVVLDFDAAKAWQDRERPVPLTPTVLTADGWQLWFRCPADIEVRNWRLHLGLEVKGTGFVPLPGSVHPDGLRYLWGDSLSAFELPPANLPEWALAMVRAKQPKGRQRVDTYPPTPQTLAVKDMTLGTLIKVSSVIPSGGLEERRPVLASVLREEGTARRLLRRAGRQWRPLGTAFPCVLPDHDERKPSASIWRTPDGGLVYRDFHMRHGRGAYRLVDVYAALETGEVRVLKAGEQVPWSVRMLSDLGLYTLPPLAIIPAPGADVMPSAQKLWQAILLLLKCRLGYEVVDPGVDGTPLTGRFLGGWANMDERTAYRALGVLLERGYLRRLPQRKGHVALYVVTGHIRHRSALAVGAGPWARDRWGTRRPPGQSTIQPQQGSTSKLIQ